MTDIPDTDSQRLWTSSIRLPPGLYEALAAKKEAEGLTMNDAIKDAIAGYVDQPALSPRNVEKDVNLQIAVDAIQFGTKAIAPLIGIGTYCSKRGQVALACVLWAAAARLVLEQPEEQGGGALAAAQQLNHSASVAHKFKKSELAIALWREALGVDPDMLEAANRLGQALYFKANADKRVTGGERTELYREAEGYLSRVVFVDNRARLYHGWSAYYVAVADKHADRSERALDEIVEALKSWAFGKRTLDERSKWLRQVVNVGKVDVARAEKLVEFASRNAAWTSVSYKDDVATRLGDPDNDESDDDAIDSDN
jgi:tetratricopeptide (TPR) repeat protein